MSIEILNCLKRRQDIRIKTKIANRNTAVMCTPASYSIGRKGRIEALVNFVEFICQQFSVTCHWSIRDLDVCMETAFSQPRISNFKLCSIKKLSGSNFYSFSIFSNVL